MVVTLRWCEILVLVVWTVCLQAEGTSTSRQRNADSTSRIEDVREQIEVNGEARVFVSLKDPNHSGRRTRRLSRQEIDDIHAQNTVSLLDCLDSVVLFHSILAMTGSIGSLDCLDVFEQHPAVVSVELDGEDGGGNLGSSVNLIGANTMHAAGIRGEGIVVAILDSGIDTDHSAFGNRLVAEACTAQVCNNGAEGPGSAEDDAGHGTAVSGIIASNSAIGGVGVAPSVQIVSIRVSNGPSPDGTFDRFSRILEGLEYLIDHPELNIDVINISLGTFTRFMGSCDSSASFLSAGYELIEILRERGIATIASVGNGSSSNSIPAPACLSNVIAVAHSTDSDDPHPEANSNSETDLFAPGETIVSANLGNTVAEWTGSSFAAAHVTGCAALLIQSGEATTPQEIRDRLKESDTTLTVPDSGLQFPRLDCSAVINPTAGPTMLPDKAQKTKSTKTDKTKSKKTSKSSKQKSKKAPKSSKKKQQRN